MEADSGDKLKISVKCNLCKADDARLLYEKDGFSIVKCRICGLVYVNPRLKSQILVDMYNRGEISPFDYYIKNKSEDEKTFEKRWGFIRKGKKSGKLLEVGCSIGTFMNIAKNYGWDVHGIDVSKKSIEYCRENGLNNTMVSRLEDTEFKNDIFDLIIMNDVIEHVSDPLGVLGIANKLLKEGGVLFITTPNIGSFISVITGKKWLHLKPDEHIYYFTTKTITEMLKKSGFKVLSYSHLGRVRNLHVVFKKFQTYSKLPYKIIRLLSLEKVLQKISLSLNSFDEIGIIVEK